MLFAKRISVLAPFVDRIVDHFSPRQAEYHLKTGHVRVHEIHPRRGVIQLRLTCDVSAVNARCGSFGIAREPVGEMGRRIFQHHTTYENACNRGEILDPLNG